MTDVTLAAGQVWTPPGSNADARTITEMRDGGLMVWTAQQDGKPVTFAGTEALFRAWAGKVGALSGAGG